MTSTAATEKQIDFIESLYDVSIFAGLPEMVRVPTFPELKHLTVEERSAITGPLYDHNDAIIDQAAHRIAEFFASRDEDLRATYARRHELTKAEASALIDALKAF